MGASLYLSYLVLVFLETANSKYFSFDDTMIQIPDHPVIRMMERTGYPFPCEEEAVVGSCSRCGRTIYEYDDYDARGFIDPDLICEDCAEEELLAVD